MCQVKPHVYMYVGRVCAGDPDTLKSCLNLGNSEI